MLNKIKAFFLALLSSFILFCIFAGIIGFLVINEIIVSDENFKYILGKSSWLSIILIFVFYDFYFRKFNRKSKK